MQIGKRQIGVQFGWNPQKTAYQNIKAQRTRIAKFAIQTQSAGSAVGSALASAAISKVNGDNTIAGQKAYARVQAEMKAALIKKFTA